MAKIGKAQASQVETLEGSFEGHYEELEGYTVGFETYFEDSDIGPLFAGLPNDRCQCPHWGVVLKGTLIYKYGDGTQDVITAGEAYYARPDHTPVLGKDTEVIEFSPTDQLRETIEVVTKNAANMA